MNEQSSGCHDGQKRQVSAIPDLVNAYEFYLETRGYQRSTRRAYSASLRHFVSWLETREGCGRRIDSEIRIFLQKHLPSCSCPQPVPKYVRTVRAALNQFLLMQGDARVGTFAVQASPEIESAVERFDRYLRNVCGHSEATRWYHRRHAREFLSWLFGSHRMSVPRITPEALCRFVTEKAGSCRPGSIGVLVYSLRSYLKFLQFDGRVTPSPVASIPRPPNWSAANLPKALSSRELTLFLSVFDCATPIGKRDYAIARCLIDLGLRCYEVANMQLSAIDWRTGVLHLTLTKSRREDALPIPETMGRALELYLRYGRPESNSEAIFLHHRAPVGQAVQNTTVRGVIRRAFSRAGLPFSGTHVLRSTFASRLFESGASIKEIADVLRHRSIDTTKSYVKIDCCSLARVAMPWPGRPS
jgi:site-specific recombinase XerD